MATNGTTELAEQGTVRHVSTGTEISTTAELAISQVEAQARALVQARFFMAAKMRRTWDDVEQRLIRECRRPRFAVSAWYIKPIGKDEAKWPRGLSIRFAEAALRLAGNIDVQIQSAYDDDWKRVVRVSVLDLETNFGYTKEVTIDKSVERRYLDSNREVLSTRLNSRGEQTYLVKATEDEVMVKQNALVSKEIRTQGLRLIPGDILDECKALIQATIASGAAAEDPETARKSIFDNFATIGVTPADLSKYLEHDTANLLPAEVVTLRGIFTAIKNGEATWKDVMAAKFGPSEGAEESEATKKLREKLAAKRTPAAAPAQTTSSESASAQAAAPQLPDWSTLPNQPAWPEDALGQQYGLRIIVADVRYERANDMEDWKRAAEQPADKPVFGEKPKARR